MRFDVNSKATKSKEFSVSHFCGKANAALSEAEVGSLTLQYIPEKHVNDSYKGLLIFSSLFSSFCFASVKITVSSMLVF